jgi:hypothetical protein
VHEVAAAAYADRLARRFGPFGPQVRGVLAYCMAAPIAHELVASISTVGGQRPLLVLFDPEPATEHAIEEQYLLAGENLGDVLGLDGPARIPPPLGSGLLRERPEEAVRHMREGLLLLGERAVAKGCADPDEARDDAEAIAAFYLDWFTHLIAAYHASWSAWGGPAVQVVSRDHACAPDWPGAGDTRTVRIPTHRNELLRHPDVADTVLAVLRERHDDAT